MAWQIKSAGGLTLGKADIGTIGKELQPELRGAASTDRHIAASGQAPDLFHAVQGGQASNLTTLLACNIGGKIFDSSKKSIKLTPCRWCVIWIACFIAS